MIRYASRSCTGDRKINEDSYACLTHEHQALFLVADGLGGYGRGEIASGTVTEVISHYFTQGNIDPQVFLAASFDQAQRLLLEKQQSLHAKAEMKTTAAALFVNGNNVCWCHVGDTRIYGFSRNRVEFRTLDHSVPQMLALSHQIPERKIRNHPDRNRLLKVMGTAWDKSQYELSDTHDIREYHAFLLCSDGFWALIPEKKMCILLRKSRTPDEWLDKMIAIIEKHGRKQEMDNYTAIAVFCQC